MDGAALTASRAGRQGWVAWAPAGAAVLLMALFALLFWVSRPAEVPGAFRISEATVQRLAAQGGVPQSVGLPHILDDEPREWWGRVSYDIPWPAALRYASREQRQIGLLMPRVGMRYRVLLNGHEIQNMGWYAPPEQTINATWQPHLVRLPASLLAPEALDNHLQVQVEARVLERSGLWPVLIGDYNSLAQRHTTLYAWQVIGTWMMLMTALIMALVSMALWRVMRERLFLLMIAASLAHGLRLALSVLSEPGMSYELYFLLHRVSFTAYIGFVVLIFEDLFGLKLRLTRALGHVLLIVGPLWMLTTLLTLDYDLYRVWAAWLAITGTVCVGQLLHSSRGGRDMNPNQRLVAVAAGFTLLTGIRDFLVVQLNFPGDADLRWTSLGSLVLMAALGWVLIRRSTGSVEEARRLNAELAQRVADSERELRLAFDQLRQAERQRTIDSERRRLMRDMHDGLGSQLVQTLNLVRSSGAAVDAQAVTQLLGHALDELRLTLDSLEPMDGDLATVLGTVRQRIAPALEGAGIDLEWRVLEVSPLPVLDAQGVMHLFRCVQEVFANVVKHARAHRVSVSTGEDEGRVWLSIADDGVGLPGDLAPRVGAGFDAPQDSVVPLPRRGRGLDNIRMRAEMLGASVLFLRRERGTEVRLLFGLDRHPA